MANAMHSGFQFIIQLLISVGCPKFRALDYFCGIVLFSSVLGKSDIPEAELVMDYTYHIAQILVTSIVMEPIEGRDESVTQRYDVMARYNKR